MDFVGCWSMICYECILVSISFFIVVVATVVVIKHFACFNDARLSESSSNLGVYSTEENLLIEFAPVTSYLVATMSC